MISLITLLTALQAKSQYVHEITHRFYFDTDISNRLRDDIELQFTDEDDGWLNGQITHIKVLGYADCRGDVNYNQTLSLARAKFVSAGLVKLGVVDENFPIEIVGAGELPCLLVGKQGDPENRRVEVVMTYVVESNEGMAEIPAEIVETGKVELVDVNFHPGRHILLDESYVPLDRFYEFLKSHPAFKIELQGHICCQPFPGDGMDNDTGIENLSEARAKAIYDYLIQRGIDASRLRYKGMGNYFPKINPELSESDRIANRRVEAVLWE